MLPTVFHFKIVMPTGHFILWIFLPTLDLNMSTVWQKREMPLNSLCAVQIFPSAFFGKFPLL